MANEQKNKTQSQKSAANPQQAKRSGKNAPKIGGSAVPGAKSTQPKPSFADVKDPNEQQMLASNRLMRRQQERMGGGAAGQQEALEKMKAKRDKRVARRQQKLEERKHQVAKVVPRSSTQLNWKNLVFPLAIGGVLLLLIALFIILRVTGVVK